MFRKIALSALTLAMVGSAAFAVNDKEAKGEHERKERTEQAGKTAKVVADEQKQSGEMKVKAAIAEMRDLALQDPKCTKVCKDQLDALIKILANKGKAGLEASTAPEAFVAKIEKLMKQGLSFSDAKDQAAKDLGVKQDKLVDCANGL